MATVLQLVHSNTRYRRMTDVQAFVAVEPSPELCCVVLDRAVTHAEEFYGSRSAVFAVLLIAAYNYHRTAGSGMMAINFGKKLRKFILAQLRNSTLRRTLSR